MTLDWQPIETAPKGEWVLVCGDSGVAQPPAFVAIAIHDADFRPLDPWRDFYMNALSDNCWPPLFWCPLPALPVMP